MDNHGKSSNIDILVQYKGHICACIIYEFTIKFNFSPSLYNPHQTKFFAGKMSLMKYSPRGCINGLLCTVEYIYTCAKILFIYRFYLPVASMRYVLLAILFVIGPAHHVNGIDKDKYFL